MATAPRRETLIALRARRTAHRVATDLYLHNRSRLRVGVCRDCGAEFVTEHAEMTFCRACRASDNAWKRSAIWVEPSEFIGEIYDEHVRQLITQCTSCRNEFVPTEAGQERCPQCMPKTSRSGPNNVADEAPPPPRGRIASTVLKIHDALMARDIIPSDAVRVIAIAAIVAAMIGLLLLCDPTRH